LLSAFVVWFFLGGLRIFPGGGLERPPPPPRHTTGLIPPHQKVFQVASDEVPDHEDLILGSQRDFSSYSVRASRNVTRSDAGINALEVKSYSSDSHLNRCKI